MAGDLSDDCLNRLLDEQMAAYDALSVEATGNGSSADSIVRHAAARKFNQEDPIEAAATEMILQKNV